MGTHGVRGEKEVIVTLRSRGPSKAPHAKTSGSGPVTHSQSIIDITQNSYTPAPVRIFVIRLPAETGPSSFKYHINFGNARREVDRSLGTSPDPAPRDDLRSAAGSLNEESM